MTPDWPKVEFYLLPQYNHICRGDRKLEIGRITEKYTSVCVLLTIIEWETRQRATV